MKTRFGEVQLKDILNFKLLETLFGDYSQTSGLDVVLYDIYGKEQLSVRRNNCVCNLIHENAACSDKIVYSGKKAMELNSPYIFETACGLVMCITAVAFEEEPVGYIGVGPVILWDNDDFFENALYEKCKQLGVDLKAAGFDPASVRRVECRMMTSAAQLLSVVVNYLVSQEKKYVEQRMKITQWNAERIRIRREMDLSERRKNFKRYPIELEKELIAYVQLGDKNKARSIINDFLSEIFSYASGDLEIIKAKLYEFTAFLSRTAVEAGAKLESLTNIVQKTSAMMLEMMDFNELCLRTVENLEDYIDVVYASRGKKAAGGHLAAAIRYIHEHYCEDVNLEDLAKIVYVSSYYLSHLFRDEMGVTFKDYLSGVRIEQSKILLKEGLSVEDVAERVGFNDSNYFIKIFKKYVGITPSKYKKTTWSGEIGSL